MQDQNTCTHEHTHRVCTDCDLLVDPRLKPANWMLKLLDEADLYGTQTPLLATPGDEEPYRQGWKEAIDYVVKRLTQQE